MNASSEARGLDATFFALSDATRRAILERLAGGDATVNELTSSFAITQPAISRHLKVLERAGLIRRSRDAQRRPARVETQAVAGVASWIQRYQDLWENTYQRLDTLLSDEINARRHT
jgi:DNA-binding transcriptional ArsR family regulator